MSNSFSHALTAFLVVCESGSCAAQLANDLVDRGKKATVLVQILHDKRMTLGSAFCIRKSGLFITTAGAVENAAIKGSVLRLVVDIGTKTQRILQAKVLRQNDEMNLALLEVADQSDLTPLDIGRDTGLKELAEVYAFGYPLGTELAESRRSYPDVIVSPSRVTKIYKGTGRFIGIDLDIPILPGASGGPIIDAAGKVVGVAVATAARSSPKPMIPAGTLATFLVTPGLVFELPPLAYKDRGVPAVWTIQVQPPDTWSQTPRRLVGRRDSQSPLRRTAHFRGTAGWRRGFPGESHSRPGRSRPKGQSFGLGRAEVPVRGNRQRRTGDRRGQKVPVE
jgi:Trypsin-like peptidase domain